MTTSAGPASALPTIREMERGDVASVAAIEAAVNPSPWSATLFTGELALPPTSRHWLVAGNGDAHGAEVIGFGGVMYAADTAHLMNLGVAVDHQRRGIGLQLCRALVAEAVRRRASALTLEVRASNHRALRLYEKLGFRAEGERPGYYPDGEDAMILWLHDLVAPTLPTPSVPPTP